MGVLEQQAREIIDNACVVTPKGAVWTLGPLQVRDLITTALREVHAEGQREMRERAWSLMVPRSLAQTPERLWVGQTADMIRSLPIGCDDED